MIVDTSALISIALDEPEAPEFALALARNPGRISAATLLETSIVADRAGDPVVTRKLDDLLDRSSIEVMAFTHRQAMIARQAYRDFGKGSGHPARLNLGDCFAYALAIDTGEPLLWKGDDFGHTGIASAMPEG
ncbi:type II toxin-antitoxin system VapC family toxin [Tsukamurella spumae]|uniref:Ribonuclease VapC n=1 Tax=Tsukamurella spumae TaxID=44753 RepID=A0A846X9G6_9ACTN|nr:type II toxin-antitoxin system VapC family toxin [Tsukamurella spumae]NKY20909.1 type II toxin-antitoxin system VapC family toxin [Tsukamurella spumae]